MRLSLLCLAISLTLPAGCQRPASLKADRDEAGELSRAQPLGSDRARRLATSEAPLAVSE